MRQLTDRYHFRTCLLLSSLIFVPALPASVFQPTATLPPQAGFYILGDTCITPVCLADITISNFTISSNQIIGGNQLSESTATMNASLFQNTGGMPGPFLGNLVLTGPVDITYFGRSTLDQIGTFDAQITFLDFTGTFGAHTAEIVLNPAFPSMGVTTVSVDDQLSGFRISSFFDIFAQLSIDGGPFVPGPKRSLILSDVPEPASAALAMVGLLALVGRRWRGSRAAPGKCIADKGCLRD